MLIPKSIHLPTVLVLLQVLFHRVDTVRLCPNECRCSIDHHGRNIIKCVHGNMRDIIPIFDMEESTKVLVITAPSYNQNYLSLGPIFQGLRRLEHIEITFSGIPSLGEHSFWGLHNLQTLNLTWNRVTSLRDSNFRGATSLKILDLSHNRIESIPSAAFRHVRQLQYLSLSYNFIPKVVPRIFFGLTRLEYLDLSYNPLRELHPDIFTDISLIRTLKCAGCGLQSLNPSLLDAVHELRELDLRNNRLTKIPERLFVTPRLKFLQLDGNHISFVDRHAIIDTHIMHLHLAHNRIIRIERDAFVNASVLHLDISYNRLTDLSPAIFRNILQQLEVLKLSGNSLNVIKLASIVQTARSLRTLGLGDVGLTGLPPDLLWHGKTIRNLNISANYLSTLPNELFVTCPNLEILDISLNGFNGISEDILEAITQAKHLRILRLEGNPWLCDKCHVAPLLRWLHGAPDQESGCDEPKVWTCLKCVGPPRFSGLELALLPPGDLPTCYIPSMKTAPSFSVEPTESLISLADEPEFPRGELTRQETASSDINVVEVDTPWTLGDLIRDRFYTIAVATCIFFVCLLSLVVIAVVAYHKQTAYYYTHEENIDSQQREAHSKQLRNNNNKSPKKVQKKASIATIDEVENIAGSKEVVECKVLDSGGKMFGKSKRNAKMKIDKTTNDAKCAYQTVVDELGRTKLNSKKSSEQLIQILDSEPRPGKV